MPAKPAVPATVDDYIATFPPGVRTVLRKVRKTVRDAEFLWDKTATGNVKATFEYKAKKA